MQSDSAKEEQSRSNLAIELVRIHSELAKYQAWTNTIKRILLIPLGIFLPLIVAFFYLSDYSIPTERTDTISVEIIFILTPLILLFLLLGGITFVLEKRISQVEKLATQIESRLKNYLRMTTSI